MKATDPCPCGNGKPYGQCCGRYHDGETASTAEALMRSRYTAYVLGLEDYLRATWCRDTCPASLDLKAPPEPKWVGLEIKNATENQVEFIARYKVNGRAHRLHEISDFVQEGGRWVYHSGRFPGDAGP